MNTFFNKLAIVFRDPIIRSRILFTLGALVIFRALAAIPVPGIDTSRLAQFVAGNEFFGLLNLFSGGGLSQLSIVMLGVGPYITGSIIMQLSTVIFPRMKEMYQEEGEAGRMKFAQYSRMLTVPLAFIQGFSFIKILETQNIIPVLSGFALVTNLLIIAAGSVLLMWIGELISEYGVGNGISLIIFSGIVAALPTEIGQLVFAFDASQLPVYLGFALAALLVILGVVILTEAERPIPVTYAKQVRGNRMYGGTSTYLPLRFNQSGVMPIIFASSLLLFPQMILRFLQNLSGHTTVQSVSATILSFLSNQWFYGIAYFVLVVAFTYFYTAVTFDPDSISKNLQKNGAFIPGVRPGGSTSEHIARILTRLTLVGALSLGIIAVLPLVVKAATGITAVSIGGTALLIVVSVVIDLVKKIDAQASIREY